jgi:hypothetical protein
MAQQAKRRKEIEFLMQKNGMFIEDHHGVQVEDQTITETGDIASKEFELAPTIAT